MKLITKYFFMTLIIIQGLFVSLYFTNFNLFGLVSWFTSGDSINPIKFFLPLIIYGVIKVLYWIAEPLSELYTIILRVALFFGIIYLVYWLFFV